ncbi:hypothetical protein Bca4012_032809 [Brassica carinata]|uniref:Copine C-terminal domain-containing protein n=1 Tax=Brassica oleracea var. oleracea TaxID=109376 RepID=A0A0D3C0X7_BRAOL
MEAIVDESSYAMSIVIVSVGDVPWADMKKFDDMIPKREFNNFQLPANILFILGKKFYVISIVMDGVSFKTRTWVVIKRTTVSKTRTWVHEKNIDNSSYNYEKVGNLNSEDHQ